MMRKRAITAMLACGAIASIAAAGAVAWPRYAHRRKLDRAIADFHRAFPSGPGLLSWDSGSDAIDQLDAIDDVEVPLTFGDFYARADLTFLLDRPLRCSIEQFACSRERDDPRVARTLEAVARDDRQPAAKRLYAYYLLEELKSPTFPSEPDGFAREARVSVSVGTLRTAIDSIRGASAWPIEVDARCADSGIPVSFSDTPWRALVRVAQMPDSLHAIVVDSGRVRIVPRAAWNFDFESERARSDELDARLVSIAQALNRAVVVVPPADTEAIAIDPEPIGYEFRFCAIDGADPEKALRALAALNGCVVRERDARTLEVVKR